MYSYELLSLGLLCEKVSCTGNTRASASGFCENTLGDSVEAAIAQVH